MCVCVYACITTHMSRCMCACRINHLFLGLSRKLGESKQAIRMQIMTDVCMCLVVAGGGGGQWNPHQTIYYNDRKQEVQPLQSHMAASCVGSKRKEDREHDTEYLCVCVCVCVCKFGRPLFDSNTICIFTQTYEEDVSERKHSHLPTAKDSSSVQ